MWSSIANTNLYLLFLRICRQQHESDTCIYVRYEKGFFLVTIFPLLRRKISQVKGNEDISEVTPLELKAAESSFAWD